MTTATLGYGCAALMGRTSRKESVVLLEAAFDAGITHFDVARSYGYGEAESAVGDFLAHRREQVTVTTKLGIEPPPGSRRVSAAKAVVRRLGPLGGGLRRVARRRAQDMQVAGSFDVGRARASLETSLAQLRTDRLDFLLLHECGPDDLTEELLSFLAERQAAGVVGAFGIASRPDQTQAILGRHDPFSPVVQVADSVVAPMLSGLTGLAGRQVFTHSALGPGLARVHDHIRAYPARASAWTEATGVDCADREQLAALFLGWARRSNATGTVLFSSRDPARIRANAAADPPGSQTLEHFAALVRDEVVP